jgi:hypothetical protein
MKGAKAKSAILSREPQPCALCGTTYIAVAELGQWRCREHSSLYIARVKNPGPGQPLYEWPCCRTPTKYSTPELFYAADHSPKAAGCVRCDHKHGTLFPYYRRPVIDHEVGQVLPPDQTATILVPTSIIAKDADEAGNASKIYPCREATGKTIGAATVIHMYEIKN